MGKNETFEEKLKKLSPEDRQKFMKQLRKKAIDDCIFCKIVRGEIPARKIYEDERVIAFLDINPVNPGHTLVIPKRHYIFITQIPDDELFHIMRVVKKISNIVFKISNEEGVMITQLNGKAAGQVVPHVHFHIIPRYPDDKMDNSWPTQKLEDEKFNEIQSKMAEMAKAIITKKEKPKEEKDISEESEDEEYEFKPRLP